MGERFSRAIAGEPWHADRVGMNVHGPGRPWDAGGPMVLHSEWWIREHWGRAFDVVEFRAGALEGQDAVVLRRRDVDLTVDELARPAADDPRELGALRHDLDELRSAMRKLNRSHDAYAAAYAAEAERRAALERAAPSVVPAVPPPRRVTAAAALRALRRRVRRSSHQPEPPAGEPPALGSAGAGHERRHITVSTLPERITH